MQKTETEKWKQTNKKKGVYCCMYVFLCGKDTNKEEEEEKDMLMSVLNSKEEKENESRVK